MLLPCMRHHPPDPSPPRASRAGGGEKKTSVLVVSLRLIASFPLRSFYGAPKRLKLIRPSAGESRQQLERIAAFDVHQLRVGKDAAVAQSLDVVDAGSVRKIGAEHDLRDRDDGGERRHRALVRCLGGVVVEALQLSQRAVRHRRLAIRIKHRTAYKTPHPERPPPPSLAKN